MKSCLTCLAVFLLVSSVYGQNETTVAITTTQDSTTTGLESNTTQTTTSSSSTMSLVSLLTSSMSDTTPASSTDPSTTTTTTSSATTTITRAACDCDAEIKNHLVDIHDTLLNITETLNELTHMTQSNLNGQMMNWSSLKLILNQVLQNSLSNFLNKKK